MSIMKMQFNTKQIYNINQYNVKTNVSRDTIMEILVFRARYVVLTADSRIPRPFVLRDIYLRREVSTWSSVKKE